MIKAVVLDIDGVILGTKTGVNFPDPHTDVIEALEALEAKGIPVCLCSAKPTFGMMKIIGDANLKNPHIGNNGATIYHADTDKTEVHEIPNAIVLEIIELAIKENIYVEVFSLESGFVQKNQESEITDMLAKVRKSKPEIVEDISQRVKSENVIRFSLIVEENNKSRINEIAEEYKDEVSLNWSTTPVMKEWIGVFTLKNISKRSGVKEISESLNIPLENMLAVGDGINDWNFMEVCGFAAAMGNGHQELKDLVKTKIGNGYIGPDVDANGIIDIFKHFNLL